MNSAPPASANATGGRRSAFAREISIVLLFILLASLFTWPLVTRLNSALPGSPGDNFREYWRTWWEIRAATHAGESITHSQMLFYPLGVDFVSDSPALIAAYLAVSPVCSALAAFNLLVILQIAAAGWTAYHLAFYLWRHRAASIIAGMIFGLSPYMLQKALGHNAMLSACFLPPAFLFTLKALENEEFRWKPALWAGFFCGLAALASTYYMLYLCLWLAGLFAYQLWHRDRRGLFPTYAVIAVVSALMLIPKLLTLAHAAGTGSERGVRTLGLWYSNGIDLLGVIIPPWTHPLWGSLAGGLNSVERASYIGITVLVLVWIGWKQRRESRWAVWTGIWMASAWILSLGPVLQVGGKLAWIPLPDLILWLIPPFDQTTTPAPWAVLTTLGAALLAAGGVKTLIERYSRQTMIVSTASALILVEYLPIPMTVTSLNRVPEDIVQEMQAHPGAILPIPLGGADAIEKVGEVDPRSLWLQSEVGLPMIGGYVQRISKAQKATFDAPLLRALIARQDSVIARDVQPQAVSRVSDIRATIKRLDERKHWAARVIRWMVGDAKFAQIIAKAEPNPVTSSALPDLTAEQAMNQADSLGIAYVMVLRRDLPYVKAARDYLASRVNLTPVWSDGRREIFRIGRLPALPN